VSDIREGIVFMPFHYGHWQPSDDPAEDAERRAANELTVTVWDPVSKQPEFKLAAVRVRRLAGSGGRPSPAPTTTASAPVDATSVPPTVGGGAAEATSTLEA
jgi:hypothetical protein